MIVFDSNQNEVAQLPKDEQFYSAIGRFVIAS